MTRRQEQLLAAIIQEFIETANAVGSVSLTDKYKFKVSPATVRNEMAELVNEGYLAKPHSSAGRVPTSMGIRYFIEELLKEFDEPDVVTKQTLVQNLHSRKFEKDQMIRKGLEFLTKVSGNATVSLVGSEVYYAGLSEILNVPEFQELDKLRTLLSVLEDYSQLQHIFTHGSDSKKVNVLVGEETGIEALQEYAVIFSPINLHGRSEGYIAVIGPNRMNYSKIIPAVEFVSQTISDAVKGW